MYTLIIQITPGDARSRKFWATFGIDQCLDVSEDRNVRPDGCEVTAGNSFVALENRVAPDGRTYHALFATTRSDLWVPWATIHATVYDVGDPADMAEYAAAVAKLKAVPEVDHEAEMDDDDDDSDD